MELSKKKKTSSRFNGKKAAIGSIITMLLVASNMKVVLSSSIDSTVTEKSLQPILDAAQAGSQVLIDPGVYKGPITINKPLHVIAKGNVVIDGGKKGDVVTLLADGIELKGFTVRNSGTDLNKDNAGIKVKSNSNRILNNTVVDDLHGIYLYSSDNNQILDNKIEGIHAFDMNDRGNGIHFFHSEHNTIDQNVISFTRDGMYFSYSDENKVDNNSIHDARYGLHYMYSNNNTFQDNVFSHNTGGSALMYSNGIVLKNNVFENHQGDKGTGIVINACDDSLIENNRIVNNTRAFYMDSSERNIIRNNSIADNFVGMEITTSSTQNQIYENNWVSVDAPVISENNSDTNEWYDTKTKQGNYWTNAELLDLNGDGVSDIPYHVTSVQSYLIGQFPDLRFLQNSPAMKLLDFIYREFPIFQIPSPVDPYPLMKPSTGNQVQG